MLLIQAAMSFVVALAPAARASETQFSFDAFARLIKQDKLNTPEAAIAALPSEMRGNYALMFRSRSLQSATFQEPRAILFTPDASFLLAFNSGSPSARGGDRVETIQFKERERRWEFREIVFSSQGDSPAFSEPNPRRCLECHQSARRADVDPRPNWEAYFVWPGAYAGVDGALGRSLGDAIKGQYPQDLDALRPLIDEQRSEAAEFAQFDKSRPLHPRYRWLGSFVPRSTLELTDRLVDLNDQRVARLASGTRDWEFLQNFFMESINCDSWQLPVPQSVPAELSGAMSRLYDRFRSRAPEHSHYIGPDRMISGFFDGRGIDTSDWSTDFRTGGRYAFSDRFGSPSFPQIQMRSAFLMASPNAFGGAKKSCEKERERATSSVAVARADGTLARIQNEFQEALNQPPALNASTTPQGLLRRCASCHVGPAASAPELPFDDLRALGASLQLGRYKRGTLEDEIAFRLGPFASSEEQMPPSGLDGPNDRDAFMAYLRTLK